jgi:hypothetical protein
MNFFALTGRYLSLLCLMRIFLSGDAWKTDGYPTLSPTLAPTFSPTVSPTDLEPVTTDYPTLS